MAASNSLPALLVLALASSLALQADDHLAELKQITFSGQNSED